MVCENLMLPARRSHSEELVGWGWSPSRPTSIRDAVLSRRPGWGAWVGGLSERKYLDLNLVIELGAGTAVRQRRTRLNAVLGHE